ncbi:MAG TPA: hypothetical protein VJR70_11290, partial [Stellaceae bacterium]|nr:hypothetical protein [Stellaceae bacterium]
MNGIFAKIARLAASKAAAFCYAVAVGVAGNLIFHMVQTHGAAPAASQIPVPEVREAAPPESARHPAVIPASPAPVRETAAPRNLPHSHAHAAVPRPPAAPPPLPETPAVALPNPDSFQ